MDINDKIICSFCKKEFVKPEDIEFIKGTKLCQECYIYTEEMKIEYPKPKYRITRDMAIDAGMPEIEGWEI